MVDVTYGTEHREPGWAERVAGTLLADDARGEAGAHPLHEQAGAPTGWPRAAASATSRRRRPGDRTFRKPKSLPTQFSRVVAPEAADFEFLRTRMGDLAVGHLRSGETVVDFEVGIPGRSLATHVGIFATTGMGKSNLMKVLAGGVLQANGRYGLLLVDPHGEYRTELARHPWAGERLRTYAARRLPNTSTLRISLAELTVDDLRTAYEWSRPQEEALFELERHYGGGTPRAWPGCSPSPRSTTCPASATSSWAAGSPSTPCRSCTAGPAASSTCRASPPTPAVSVGGAVVRDLERGQGRARRRERPRVHRGGAGGLVPHPPGARALGRRLPRRPRAATSGCRWWPSCWRRRSGCWSLQPDRESNVFPRVAREGRKFKVGLCAITQQPKLLDDELLSQFNTFFVLGLADEKDRNILRSSSKQDICALGPEIQTLMPGECLVANLEAPFAVPAKVHLYDDVVRATAPPPAPRPTAAPNVAALVD